ncbi:MAG TPA: hypothetical protein V6D17_22155 [Candidatus Obscuribacterales bacterium]
MVLKSIAQSYSTDIVRLVAASERRAIDFDRLDVIVSGALHEYRELAGQFDKLRQQIVWNKRKLDQQRKMQQRRIEQLRASRQEMLRSVLRPEWLKSEYFC